MDIEKMFPSYKNLIMCDSYQDIISLRARTPNARHDDLEYIRFLKQDDSIEEQYKSFLCYLLSTEETPNAECIEKNDSEQKKTPNEVDERRAIEDGVDGCNGTEEQNDHQYELFLEHLKGHGKSYSVEYMKDGLSTGFEYEGDVASDKGNEPQPEPRRKLSTALEPQPEPRRKLSTALEPQPEPRRKLSRALEPQPEPRRKLSTALEPQPEPRRKLSRALEPQQEPRRKRRRALEPQPEPRRNLRRACNMVRDKNPRMLTRTSKDICGPSNQHKYVPQSVKKVSKTVKVVDVDGSDDDYVIPQALKKVGKTVRVVDVDDSDDDYRIPQAVKKVGKTVKVVDFDDSDDGSDDSSDDSSDDDYVLPQSVKRVSKTVKVVNIDRSDDDYMIRQSVKKVGKTVKVENVDSSDDYYMMPNPKIPNIRQNVRLRGDQNVCMRKPRAVVNEKQRNRFPSRTPKVEKQQATLVEKIKGPARGKSRNETHIKEENHAHRNGKLKAHGSAENEGSSTGYIQRKQPVGNLNRKVKQEPKFPNLMSGKNLTSLFPNLMSGKNLKSLPLKKPKIEAQNVRIEKVSPSEHRRFMAANCFTAHKKGKKVNLEEGGKGGSDSDVEILGDDLYLNKGINHPFVLSKKFSMMECGNLHVGGSRASDEFREAIVKAIRKPYNKDEYAKLQKTVQDLCYLDYYPDLQRKLKKFRYSKKKRLAILRGFFFYLQNVTREGAFKPWKDRACLLVEPPSP